MISWSSLNLFLSEKTPDNEDYESGPEEIDIDSRPLPNEVPEFISLNQTLFAKVGKPFRLGCQVNKLDQIQVCSVAFLNLKIASSFTGKYRTLQGVGFERKEVVEI